MAVAIAASLLAAACGSGTQSNAGPHKFKVAMILPGKANDFGYSQLGATALGLVRTQFGADTAIAESVATDQQVQAFRTFASGGYDLVVGWGGQFEDGAKQVAAQFPKVYFADFGGNTGNGSNYEAFFPRNEQYEFLMGYADARVSKSHKVGMISASCFASGAEEVHGWVSGVKYADPTAQTKVIGVNSFDDPAAAKAAALALITAGVDVIHAGLNTGNLGIFQAAQEKSGILVSTQFFDQHSADPKHVYTSSIIDQSKPLLALAAAVENHTFNGQPLGIPLTATEDAVAPFNGLAPDSLYAEVKDLQKKVGEGSVKVTPDPSCPY